MRCVAVLETTHPQFDTVILWGDDTRRLAFAYKEARVMMSRPTAGSTVEQDLSEAVTSFQITREQIVSTTVVDGAAQQPAPLSAIAPGRTRW